MPEGTDLVARLGLAWRRQVSGPMAVVQVGGTHTWNAVAADLFPELSVVTQAPDLADVIAATRSAPLSTRHRQAALAQLMRAEQPGDPVPALRPLKGDQ